MKFLVIGSTKGDFDIINQHIERTNADVVLSTGDLGLFYRNEKFHVLPKLFKRNGFPDYIEGKKTFLKPVYTVRGAHDNLGLCKKLVNKDISIKNFHLFGDGETVSIPNNTTDSISLDKIVIGGIGGSYSPKYFSEDKLTGNARRHFSFSSVDLIKKKTLQILLLHDVIGDCSKKQVNFSDAALTLLKETSPFYCFCGKFHWWSASKILNVNVVLLSYAEKGYLLLDTNKEWDAEAIRFDLQITNTKGNQWK